MKKGKKLLGMMLGFSVMTTALSGCGNSAKVDVANTEIEFKEEATEQVNKKEDPNGDTPTDEGYGILREARTEKIGSLNPQTYINSYSSDQIKRASLLLYTYFPNEDYTFCELSGELAAEDPIQVDSEGKVWQIKLREGVVWENGDTLDADDVIYTWKMMLDPKLANLRASNFAKDVIEIENAMAYFQGECTWEEVTPVSR